MTTLQLKNIVKRYKSQAVLDDLADFSAYQVYACGAPGMIDAARNDFSARGLPADEFFADAFTFST